MINAKDAKLFFIMMMYKNRCIALNIELFFITPKSEMKKNGYVTLMFLSKSQKLKTPF